MPFLAEKDGLDVSLLPAILTELGISAKYIFMASGTVWWW